MSLGGPGELLASSSLPPLVLGSGIEFSGRGSHKLKGLDGVLAHRRRDGGVSGAQRLAIRGKLIRSEDVPEHRILVG